MTRAFRRLFALPFRTRESIARDVDEELAFHIEMRARDLAGAGMAPADALRAARAEFGDVEGTRRYLNDTDRRTELATRLGGWIDEARQDTWLALRQAARSPAVTLLAAGTLALGIGASTAIYSVVHGVLFAPLPYADQDRVVVLHQFDRASGRAVNLAPLNFTDFRERARSYSHVAIAEPYGMSLVMPGVAARLDTWRVTAGFFEALGAPPLLGRAFLPAEYEPGAGHFVMLSHRVWQQRFAGDSSIIGRAITLDGDAHVVVGVLSPRFTFPSATDIYVPRETPRAGVDRANRVATYLHGVARLKPEVTLAAAREEAGRIALELARLDPAANRQMGAVVTPLHEHLTGRVATLLLVLLGAVLLVQLIACANVGNLLLARGVTRRREMALRAALGAGRGRLARQLLAESAVLALLALAGGIALGEAGVRLLRATAPADLPRLDDIVIGAPVLGFALALAVFTVMVAGLAPALQQSRADAGATLRDGTPGAGRRRLPRAFVAAEVALTLMLLIGAGLLLRSHARLLREDLGFNPDRTLAMTLHVWGDYPDPARRIAFFDELIGRIGALPGVQAAAAANALPLSRLGSEMDPPFMVEGAPAVESGNEPTAVLTIITPKFFETMGIRLRRGRALEPRDDAGGTRVVVVNETMARAFFPGVDPIGRRVVLFGRDGARIPHEIVGVTADVRHTRLDETPRPEIYIPLAQRSFGSMTVVVRHGERPDPGLYAAIQAALWSLKPGLLFDDVERLDQRLAETLAPRRFALTLVALFAVIAFALALVGIYGAVSFAVSQRTGEIGVRMALGARASGVVGMLVREGLLVVGAGTIIGAALAAALTRLMRGLLFGVSPLDPLTFVVIAVIMLATAALAAWLPASRAARVDPASVIRAS